MSVNDLAGAARVGNVDDVTRLLNNGININGFSTWNETALMQASYNGHEALVRLLLSRGANVNLANKIGHTALMAACNGGRVSEAELLLRSGADHTLKHKEDGMTALEKCKDSAKRAQLQAVINSLCVSAAPPPPPPTASTPAPIPALPPIPSSTIAASNAATMEQLRAQLASMTSERDSLQRQLTDRTREKESLNTQLQGRTMERDGALAEKSQVVAQLREATTHLADRTREKDTLDAQLVDRISQLAQRTTERDSLALQLNAAVADRARLTAERSQLASQRDALQTQLAEKDSLIEQLIAAAAAGDGTTTGSASNSSAFERYRPHMFVPNLVPCCRHPGIHDVSNDSALFRTCSSLCNVGGNWYPTPGQVAGFKLVAVQAVVHEEDAYKSFEYKQSRITKQRQNGGDYFNFSTGSMNAAQLLVLSALREQFHERAPGTASKGANSFYCYHGPRAEHVGSICSTGMVATGSMDAGFFGCGCYTTLNMEYALRYARGDFDADGGPRLAPGSRYPIIMFAATTGMAYPVTPAGPHGAGDYGHPDSAAPPGSSDFYGRALKRGFDCHVVCVSQASNWQAVERDRCQYVEVVIDQQDQLLPVAVLWFEDLSGF